MGGWDWPAGGSAVKPTEPTTVIRARARTNCALLISDNVRSPFELQTDLLPQEAAPWIQALISSSRGILPEHRTLPSITNPGVPRMLNSMIFLISETFSTSAARPSSARALMVLFSTSWQRGQPGPQMTLLM